MNLARYRHDRSRPIDKTIRELYRFIEDFADQESLSDWYAWFDRHLQLPELVVKQYLKRNLAINFDYLNECRFNDKYLKSSVSKDCIRYPGFLIYIWMRRKQTPFVAQRFDLMLDHIEWDFILELFEKLIDMFGRDNVVAVVPGSQRITFPDLSIQNYPQLVEYSIELREASAMLRGINFHTQYSFKSGINLLRMAIGIINSFFYYRTIFRTLECDHCLMYQHYQTNAIKNHLFKKMGGKRSSAIQKNIHQRGRNGFYYDADLFFSLGEATANPAIEFGAKISEVKPVGSLFLEQFFFSNSINNIEPAWDIVVMGGNEHYPGSFNDTYDTHNDDYKESLNWVLCLSKAYQELKIGFKHHANYRAEPIEQRFFENSNVEIVDQKVNSYELGFQSKVVLTWASTIAVELRAHGIPSFFLDPGGRNGQYVESTGDWLDVKLTTYNEFQKTIVRYLFSKQREFRITNDLCLKSETVSEAIYDKLRLGN